MGRFDDAAPSAEHGPKGARKNSKFKEEETCFDVARCRVASSSQVVMGTLQEC